MAQNIKYENTSGSRFGLVDAIMDRDPSKVLFASGAFSKDKEIAFLNEKTYAGKISVVTDSDSGVFVLLWLKFGYLGILYFALLLMWSFYNGRTNGILFFIVSLSKIPVFTPIFIIFYSTLISTTNKKLLS